MWQGLCTRPDTYHVIHPKGRTTASCVMSVAGPAGGSRSVLWEWGVRVMSSLWLPTAAFRPISVPIRVVRPSTAIRSRPGDRAHCGLSVLLSGLWPPRDLLVGVPDQAIA